LVPRLIRRRRELNQYLLCHLPCSVILHEVRAYRLVCCSQLSKQSTEPAESASENAGFAICPEWAVVALRRLLRQKMRAVLLMGSTS
jgi:hypothetical protein